MVDNPLSREKKFRAAAVSKCLGSYDIDVRRTNISKYLLCYYFVPSHQRLLYRIAMTAKKMLWYWNLGVALFFCSMDILFYLGDRSLWNDTVRKRVGWVGGGTMIVFIVVLNIWKLLLWYYPTGWNYTQNLV